MSSFRYHRRNIHTTFTYEMHVNVNDLHRMHDRINKRMPVHLRIIDGMIAFALRSVLRYRRDVITKNLESAFVHSSQNELEEDIKSNYLYMAKILRQTIVKPSKELLIRRMHLSPGVELDQWLNAGQSVIATFGHVGNWEWTGSFLGIQYPDKVCALFKKIKSKRVNKLMHRRRLSHVKYLVESKQMGELLRLMQKEALLILMIADQNPGSSKGILWEPFLGRETAFVSGPENLARKYNLPVVYIQISPRQDGGYDLACLPIFDGHEEVENGEIMKRYAMKLEENIKAFRSEWLWSHKRWKRSKKGESKIEQ